MTADLLVVAPVLNRPGNAQRVADSLREATHVPYRLLFVVTHGDDDELAAVRATGADYLVVPWQPGRGDYARKVNLGYSRGREPWLFQAADDLRFQSGWDDVALTVGERTGAGVVGTNDLGNPRVMSRQASTHSLIWRPYVEELGGEFGRVGTVLHPGYWHNFCDEELVDLARTRGRFVHAHRCYVEHLHPHWHKAETDATYRLGEARFRVDQQLFGARQRRWRRGMQKRRPARVP